MKLSPAKATLPGAKQVFRAGSPGDDLIGLRREPVPADRTPLLVPVMTAGRRLTDGDEHGPATDIDAARRRFEADRSRLPAPALLIRAPKPPRPGITAALCRLRDDLRSALFDRLISERLPLER